MTTLVFTGGHHTSALLVASQLKKNQINIVWFGHRHSMWADTADSAEYQDVTQAQIPFYNLQAGKFHRTYHPLKLLKIPFGFLHAMYLLLKIRPQGIVSFGGYLAVPVVLCAWLLGIPAITHEQTVTAGWANKLISLFVKKIALTWPHSHVHYPSSKSVLIGLPISNQLLVTKNKSRANSTRLQIFITGGKQGSHVINQAIFAALPELLKSYRVIHQTGFSSLHQDFQQAGSLSFPNYTCFAYDREKYYSALSSSDIIISRSGAHTVYDLALLGKKAVLIPIPWVSHQEQFRLATVLVENQLAVILNQNDLSSPSLISALQKARSLSGHPLALPTDATQRMISLIKQELL